MDCYDNQRVVVMTRGLDKIIKSWLAAKNKKDIVPLLREYKDYKNYPHIIVDYDTFVTEPETYREDFEKLFPELDFTIIISGIDTNLYINR